MILDALQSIADRLRLRIFPQHLLPWTRIRRRTGEHDNVLIEIEVISRHAVDKEDLLRVVEAVVVLTIRNGARYLGARILVFHGPGQCC